MQLVANDRHALRGKKRRTPGKYGRALEGCSDTTDDDELDLLLAEDE